MVLVDVGTRKALRLFYSLHLDAKGMGFSALASWIKFWSVFSQDSERIGKRMGILNATEYK